MQGIISVLNTPFAGGNTIDVTGLARNVENAIAAGISGFLVPALASEVGTLSGPERMQVVSTVIAAAAGRAPVIGGASSLVQRDRVRYARELTELGCAGVLVNMPLEDKRKYEANLQQIADTNPGFIMLQDWDPLGSGLPLDFVFHLFETIPSFEWLKIEVVPAGPKYSEVLERGEGRLKVAGGWAVMQMLDGLDRGVHAFMPTGMHWIYAAICRLYKSGDRAGAEALFAEVLPVLTFSNQNLEVSVQFFKQLLHAQGVYETAAVRIDVDPFSAADTQTAESLIQRVIALESSLTDG